MKQRIDPSWVRRLIRIAVMAAIVKIVMVAVELLLPYEGVESVLPSDDGISHTLYKPSVLFGLRTVTPTRPSGGKGAAKFPISALTLKGLYLDSVHAFIIVESGGKDTLISKGDVFQGYKLVDLLPSEAIFEKNGQRYALAFKEDKGLGSAITRAQTVVSENGFTAIKRKTVQYYSRNFDAIWQNIKIQELYENKQLIGFVVKWIKKDSIFAKMGLETNDIITGINGKPVSSVSQVLKLYQNVDNLDNLTLTIKRNNTERQLDYAIYD